MKIFGLLFLIIVFWITLLAGTAYLVQVCKWSAWWFIPSVLICSLIKINLSRK